MLPEKNFKLIESQDYEFFSEDIDIKQIDYYFTNAIARSSKTMSDCKIARNSNSKN